MKYFKLLNDSVEKLYLTAGVLFLIIFIIVVFTQVVVRNYLHIPMLWSHEVAVFSFVWSLFLGSAVAVRRRRHYVVEIIPARFVKFNLALDILADLAIFAVIYIMITSGWTYTRMGLSRFSTSIAVRQAYYFASIPVSGMAMFLFALENLFQTLRKARTLLMGGKVNEPARAIDG
ncbi:MAG: TRAP transporter small permease [Dethiobacter sp.]|nr:TRAP transporter small permease [Dethiobacter sp.]